MAKSKKKSIKSKQRKKRSRKLKDMAREGTILPAPPAVRQKTSYMGIQPITEPPTLSVRQHQ